MSWVFWSKGSGNSRERLSSTTKCQHGLIMTCFCTLFIYMVEAVCILCVNDYRLSFFGNLAIDYLDGKKTCFLSTSIWMF